MRRNFESSQQRFTVVTRGRRAGRTAFARAVIAFAVGLPAMASAPLVLAESKPPVHHDLEIRDGALVGDEGTLRVDQGSRVELRWSSDTAVELHLHGYGVTVHVAPDAPATMIVDARVAGRFPVETHGSGGHRIVLYLEVHPD